jgi:hypothetical protein
VIDFDRAFHRLDVVELHHRLDLELVLAEDQIDRLAGRDVRVEADELLAREVLHLEIRAFRQRVLRVRDQDQVIVAERQHLDLPLLHRKRHQPEIDRIVQDVLVDQIRTPVFDAHIHRREIMQEFFDERRQLVQPDRVNRRDANRAADHLLHLLQFREQFLVGVQHLLRRLVHALPLARELKLLLTAVDEEGLEVPLHRARLLADRRLRDAV